MQSYPNNTSQNNPARSNTASSEGMTILWVLLGLIVAVLTAMFGVFMRNWRRVALNRFENEDTTRRIAAQRNNLQYSSEPPPAYYPSPPPYPGMDNFACGTNDDPSQINEDRGFEITSDETSTATTRMRGAQGVHWSDENQDRTDPRQSPDDSTMMELSDMEPIAGRKNNGTTEGVGELAL